MSGFADMQFYNLVLQSSDTEVNPHTMADESSFMEQEQTMSFMDNVRGQVYMPPAPTNPIATVDGTPDISLGQFLSRPTLIQTIVWDQSTPAGTVTSMQPWHAFFNNVNIKKKIDNFAFIRCNLKIKVLVNASPFFYGMALTAWNPLDTRTTNLFKVTANPTQQLTVYSQMPHIKIFPGRSAGGEMMLPFFWHENWIKLVSAADLQAMGRLNFVTATLLQSANAVTSSSVSVQVYAWAENVELSGSTIQLALQSKDEYGDGPISAPASAVANVARRLTDVPVIGKFARATQIGASAVSSVARLFGFSNVPVIDNVHPFQNANLPHLATSGIGTAVQKLTLDPKHELSIDPSLHGLDNCDPFDISSIIEREAIISIFEWTTSDVVGDQLFNCRVTPSLGNVETITGAKRLALTPMSFVAQLFNYWRGDIVLRFKFVCSKFHKGRVRITYDPIGLIDADANSQNVCFTHIVDIGEDNDIEMVIPYHQPEAWKRIRFYTDQTWAPGSALPADENYDNGLLNVRVLTNLSAPAAPTPVYVIVSAFAGPNMEYCVPNFDDPDSVKPFTVLSVQSQDEEDKVDIKPTRIIVGSAPNYKDPNRYLMNYGESVNSLRQVFQRSIKSETIYVPTLSLNQYSNFRQLFGRLPLIPGYGSSGKDDANRIAGAGTSTYNFVPNHPLIYILQAFKGYRGSMHHHFNIDTQNSNYIDSFEVYRHGNIRSRDDRRGVITNSLATTATPAQKRRFLNTINFDNGAGGMGLTSQRNNNSLSVYLPDFNRYNFRYVNATANTLGSSLDDSDIDTYGLTLLFKPDTAGKVEELSRTTITRYTAIGADFTPLFFIAVPIMDYYDSNPTAP